MPKGDNARKTTDEEFKSLWRTTGGSPAEVSRLSGTSLRVVYARRRRIEETENAPLLGGTPSSPDFGIVAAEFPDWQQLEIKDGLLVAFSDAHLIPHRKSTAHKALLRLIAELKPKAVVEMGDLLDFASISRHHRIGWDRQLSVREELEWAGAVMAEVKDAAGGAKTMKLMGNHDQRFGGTLGNRETAFEGVPGFNLMDHLPDWPVSWAVRVNQDQLELKHRWRGGIHAPWNNTMNAGISYGTGHLHSQKVYPLTDLRGDRWGVDVGTLSSIYGPHFRWMEAAPRNWRSGFAVFRFVNYKLRQPELVRVVSEPGGVVEYCGRDYSV